MNRSTNNPWLSAYAWLTVAATLGLICVGGLVTSHGAGMAVPDWPNTYGYNMFFFPVSQWVGGIFYEHTHRLAASGVGLMTTVLAVWLWLKESRAWLRWLGVLAFFLVVIQGVLGGLRVTLLRDELGLVHGALAQTFLSLLAAIALFTTRFWERLGRLPGSGTGVQIGLLLTTALIFGQLLLGAGMRHRHAGLAVPDFPLAHGRWWPPTDPESVAGYNRKRLEVTAARDLAPLDVQLHLVHRYTAVLILAASLTTAVVVRRRAGPGWLARGAWLWLGLILVQATLGAWTVLSGKAADIATAHVAVGSTTLALGVLLSLLAFRQYRPDRVAEVSARDPASPPASLAAAATG